MKCGQFPDHRMHPMFSSRSEQDVEILQELVFWESTLLEFGAEGNPLSGNKGGVEKAKGLKDNEKRHSHHLPEKS